MVRKPGKKYYNVLYFRPGDIGNIEKDVIIRADVFIKVQIRLGDKPR